MAFLFYLFHVEHLDTFGKRLRASRKGLLERRGSELTQGQLGALVGRDTNTVSSWEGGIAIPPVEIMEKLAGALGVTPGWLAFGQEPRYEAESPSTTEVRVLPWQKQEPPARRAPKAKRRPKRGG